MAWCNIDPRTEPQEIVIGAIRAEYELCKKVPGAHFDGAEQLWRFPKTWPTWACFCEIWKRQPVDVRPELAMWAAERWEWVEEAYRMRAAIDCEDAELLTQMMSMELDNGPHLTPPQRGAVACLVRYPRYLYNDQRGSGKTPPLCRALAIKHADGEAAPALVVCPPQSLLAWQRKLAAWAPELRTVIIGGTAKPRADAIRMIGEGKFDVGLIAWPNVRLHTRLAGYPGKAFVKCPKHGGSDPKITPGRCEMHEKDGNDIPWRTVIADEAHWMADEGSKQTRAVWWLAHHAETFWAVTGTEIVNGVDDIWPIFHAMDPMAYPVKSKFLDLFAVQGYAYRDVGKVVLDLRSDTEETFHLVTRPYYRRIPRQITRPGEPGMAEPEFRYPEMGHKGRQLYDAIAKVGLAELEDRDLVPENSVVAFTRLCQLAGSMITVEDGVDPLGFTDPNAVVDRVLPSHKISDLLEFLADEDPRSQWIIGCNSPAMAALAEGKLADAKITFTHILGGMTYQAKDAAALMFNQGDARVIFVNQAGRESIDLPAAEGVFWLEPNPSYVHREQIEGRGDRFGRTTPMRRVYSLTPGSVEIRLHQMGDDKEGKHQRVVQDAATLRWAMSVAPGEINEDTERIRT